jgi:hypothetical protein
MKRSFTFLIVFSLFITACKPPISGSGDVTEKEYAVDDIEILEVSGVFDVYVKQGSTEKVFIQADDNFFEYIDVEAVDGRLEVEMERIPTDVTALELYVQVTDLQKIRLNGAVDFDGRGIRGEELEIQVNGSSDLDLDLEEEFLSIELNGASELKLSGNASDLVARINGASDLFARDLRCDDVDIEVNGAGTAEVWATERLKVDVKGAGSIRYRGNPELYQEITGAGSVKRMD